MSRSKNKSRTYKDGMRVQTRDNFFYGSDYFDHRHPNERDLYRKTYIVDSNRNDELAIVKYTTSKKNGKKFTNNKGFDKHGKDIYTKDNEGNPIKIDGKKFSPGSKKRKITGSQANEIKRRTIKETKYGNLNQKKLRELKNR